MSPAVPTNVPSPGLTGNTVLYWLQALRAKFYIVTVLPVTAALLLASHDGHYDGTLAALTLIGALAMHVGTNLANDYYDYVQYEGDLPYHGGSGVIQEGKLPAQALHRAAWLAFAIAAGIGLYLSSQVDAWVLAFTGAGLFGGIFYSAPPIRFGYRGLAEVICGISMGPVLLLGTYYVQARALSPEALAAMAPLASFVAFILFAESITDIYEDRQTGKWTLAARLGEQAALRLYQAWVAITGVLIGLLVAVGLLPGLLAIELVPVALVLVATRLATGKQGVRSRAQLLPLGRQALLLYLTTGILLVAGLAIGGA